MEANRQHDTFDLTKSLIDDGLMSSPQPSTLQLAANQEAQRRIPSHQQTLPSDLMLSSSFVAKNNYFQLKSQMNAQREQHIQQLQRLKDAFNKEKHSLEQHYLQLLEEQRRNQLRRQASDCEETLLIQDDTSADEEQKLQVLMLEQKIARLDKLLDEREQEKVQLRAKIGELEQAAIDSIVNRQEPAEEPETNSNNVSFGWPVSEIRKQNTDTEVEQLRKEKEQLQTLNREVQQQLEELKSRTAIAIQFEEETALLQERLRSAENEVSFDQQQIKTLKQGLQRSEETNRRLKEEHQQKLEQLSNIQHMLEKEMKQYAIVAEETTRLNQQLTQELSRQNERVRALTSQQQTNDSGHAEELQQIRDQLLERDSANQQLKKQLDGVLLELTAKNEELRQLELRHQEMRAEQLSKMQQAARLEKMGVLTQEKGLEQQLRLLQQEISQMREENLFLRQQLEESRQELQAKHTEYLQAATVACSRQEDSERKYQQLLRKSKEAVAQLTEGRRRAEYEKFKADEKLLQLKTLHEKKLEEVNQSVQDMLAQLHRQKEFYALSKKQLQEQTERRNQDLVQANKRIHSLEEALQSKSQQLEEAEQLAKQLTADCEDRQRELTLQVEGGERLRQCMLRALPKRQKPLILPSVTHKQVSLNPSIIDGLVSDQNSPRHSLYDDVVDEIDWLVAQKNRSDEQAKLVALELYKCRRDSDQRIFMLTCEAQSLKQRISHLDEEVAWGKKQLQACTTPQPSIKDLKIDVCYKDQCQFTQRDTPNKPNLNQSLTERSEYPSNAFKRPLSRQRRPKEKYIVETPRKTPMDISWERAKQRTFSELQCLTATSASCLNLFRYN